MEKESMKEVTAESRKAGRESIGEAMAEIDEGVLNEVLAGNKEKKSRHTLTEERVEIAALFYEKIAKAIQEEEKMKKKRQAEEEELKKLERKKAEDERLKKFKEKMEKEEKKEVEYWDPDEVIRNTHSMYIDNGVEDPRFS